MIPLTYQRSLRRAFLDMPMLSSTRASDNGLIAQSLRDDERTGAYPGEGDGASFFDGESVQPEWENMRDVGDHR